MRTLLLTSTLLASLLLTFQPAWGETVDINSADASTLAKAMVGIGPQKAAAIVEYRTKHGPFKSVAELDNVPGLGAKLVEANKDKITATPPAVNPAPAGTKTPQ